MIQTVSSGPIKLVGYSFGACIAVEMALQLQKQNGVSSLVLLDGSHISLQIFVGRTMNKAFGSADSTASMETLLIREFVSNLVLRLDVCEMVCFFCSFENSRLN